MHTGHLASKTYTEKQRHHIKRAHQVAFIGGIALIAARMAVLSRIAFKKGVRAGERRTIRAIEHGELEAPMSAEQPRRRHFAHAPHLMHRGHHHDCCGLGEDEIQD